MMKAILSLEDVIRQAVSSEAYRDIHPDVIRRVCEAENHRGFKGRELVKAIRGRLHQIGGAYLPSSLDPEVFRDSLSGLPRDLSASDLQAYCRKKMEMHASTRERLPYIERFFHEVLEGLPPVCSVLDLACGLTPLSLPWMPLHPEAVYTAVDMYRQMAECLQVFFEHTGFCGQALAADILTFPFDRQYDVILLLKTLPCLEQQGKGCAAALVDSLPSTTIILSYPLRTLGGSRKGLGATYEADFNRLAHDRFTEIKRFEFPNELVFRVRKP
jgi:16S rRNA (guanine(1405)-N(7))-methyltransferase